MILQQFGTSNDRFATHYNNTRTAKLQNSPHRLFWESYVVSITLRANEHTMLDADVTIPIR
jgi:hypothetical protein